MGNEQKRSEERSGNYADRHYGSAGGYNQTGPSLAKERSVPEAAPRVAPSRDFPGGHLDRHAAEHGTAPSEREPGAAPQGPSGRFREDGFNPDRIDSELAGTEAGPDGAAADGREAANELLRRLAENDALDATDIRVRVENGTAVLMGTVDSREARDAAEDLAREVHGVRDITNLLQIQSSRLGQVPRPTG